MAEKDIETRRLSKEELEGKYFLGLKTNKKTQFIHQSGKGFIVRNGIHKGIVVLQDGDPDSEKFYSSKQGTRFEEFEKMYVADFYTTEEGGE